MNIQIFGTKKCPDTRKAERFFKERGIKFQAIDLAQKGMSAGELRSVSRSVGSVGNRTPIVRDGSRATVGFVPEVWSTWIDESRG